jgi:RNA polymerase sigma factor (sigma-70 family)
MRELTTPDVMDKPDAALVGAASTGDSSAFAILVERHRPALHALCLRALRDPAAAEDAEQEAILQAFLSLHRLRQPERFGPWLCGIGLNVCRRLWRERLRAPWSWEVVCGGREIALPADASTDPELRAEALEVASIVRRAVEILPVGQRAAVLLYYLRGLSHLETAALLGIETSAVKTRLHKARRTLHRRLIALWKEETMATEIESSLVDMRVADVRRPAPKREGLTQYIIVLEEVNGDRRMAIWVGRPEAEAMALQLTQTDVPRPMTYGFFAGILGALGRPVREVHINRLADSVFYAVAAVDSPAGLSLVDARPSDALNLAVTLGIPIRVDHAVLDQVSDSDPVRAQPGTGTADAAAIAAEMLAERLRQQ